ncbi:DUF2802 domain-containing protein [uncultured Pseudoteredinibacter sp.]|uniref:DUF2802 domain-containing protein n=1 Tax=uncultured Pseudoteredinibacter sp. TaxID=1641701 RepID=UPI00262557C2|nr:DUF2802 domain-containing protein [uncultured Pseudoteredinibacter sp.]
MFAAMLHPTVYIGAGLALGVLLLCVSYWRQNRQIQRQLQDLQRARQELKSINASNIGLGRRIKSLEADGGPRLNLVEPTQFAEQVSSIEQYTKEPYPAEQEHSVSETPDTVVAKDLRELQAQQQSLLASLAALEQESGLSQAKPVEQVSIPEQAFAAEPSYQEDRQENELAPSFQDSLSAQLEQDALSEQHFNHESLDSESAGDALQSPYSYDDEPEPDLEQTPYTRASAMLDEGLELDEIERQSGLSKAEIKLMATMHKNMSKFALA